MEYIEPKPREEKPHAKRNKIIIASVAGAVAVAAVATAYTLLIKNVFLDYKNINIFTYSYATDGSSNGVTITGIDDSAILPAKFRIPAKLSGRPVIGIADEVFSNQEDIVEVIFPDSLEFLGERSFAECTSLKKFNAPKNLKSIGKDAFADTQWLESAEDGEVAVGPILYDYKGEMDPDTAVVASEDSALASAHDNIIDLSKYKAVASGAFKQQDNLVAAELPEAITEVADSLFEECSSLETVELGDHVTSIGSNAFNSCLSLVSIDFPSSLESIGSYAFAYSKLTGAIELGSHIQSIGTGVFRFAREITKVTLPYGFDSVPDYTFEGCQKLAEVKFDAQEYDSTTSKISYIGASAFKGTAVTNVDVPFNVTTIKSQAFAECPELVSVSVYNNVSGTLQNVHVWDEDTQGYKWVVSDSTYQGVNVLSEGAFYNSPKFNALRVNTKGTLSAANEVHVPVTLIIFGGTNSDSFLLSGTAVETLDMTKDLSVVENETFKTALTEGSKLSILPPSICENALSLKNIVFSNETEKINRAAFKGCTSLQTVTMSDSIKELGTNMFENCSQLATVSLSKQAQSVPSSAFENCTALTTIEIPSSVKTIGDKAFKGCSSLTSVTYEGATSSVTNIGSAAFENCTSLVSFNMGDACNAVLGDVFKGCTSLTSVVYSSNNRLASVKSNMFANTALTSITLDANIQRIEAKAFENCTALKTVTLKATRLVALDQTAFDGCSVEHIYVPADLVAAYTADATWSAVCSSIQAIA